MSGTRSNPPHNPAYGGDYGQDGSYASLGGGLPGHAAPYAGEGTSEAAEYYYEGQYDQQNQQYQYDDYGQYGQYGEPSAGYDQQQGYAPGYGEQAYQAGEPGQGYESRHGGGQHAGYQEYSEYEAAGYATGDYGQDYPSAYPSAEAPAYADADEYGYQAPEGAGGYPDATAEYYDGPGGAGAPLFGAASSFAIQGSATATATDRRTAALGTDTLVEPEAPPAPPEPAAVPAPRRARTAAPARPETAPAPASDGPGRRPTLRTRPRTGPLGRVVQGVVLAALIGGALTYVAYDKTITLSVDGRAQTVHTFAGTVGAVLTADGVSTGNKDIVSPATGDSAASGQTITVRYGRPLSLSVNGVTKQTWVHYPTVEGALAELGVRTAGAKSSDPMDQQIPRSGMTGLVVFTMRHITFLVDGKSVPLNTTAATVSAAMSQAGVVLHNQDAPSVPASSVPVDGETIAINRITGTTETKQVSIPFQTTKTTDSSAYVGTSTVKTEGVDGEETVTYALLTINGKAQKPKQISAKVTKQPVTEVVAEGTKALPTSASSLNWAALANCESGGNPSTNTGNGFYGMYQFTIGTWDALGGSGLPSNASAATQTALAEKLYTESGAGQWPVCGHLLFS